MRFASVGGEPFIALAGVGAQSGAAPGVGTDAIGLTLVTRRRGIRRATR